MTQLPIEENIQAFLTTLPSTTMSLILYDQANHIVGFVVFDRSNPLKRAKIYNLNCQEITSVVLKTTIKEMVEILLSDQCTYVT
jgi:hypothetical protein